MKERIMIKRLKKHLYKNVVVIFEEKIVDQNKLREHVKWRIVKRFVLRRKQNIEYNRMLLIRIE
jgi:hypothetical protein